jgi:hypothetical protein
MLKKKKVCGGIDVNSQEDWLLGKIFYELIHIYNFPF